MVLSFRRLYPTENSSRQWALQLDVSVSSVLSQGAFSGTWSSQWCHSYWLPCPWKSPSGFPLSLMLSPCVSHVVCAPVHFTVAPLASLFHITASWTTENFLAVLKSLCLFNFPHNYFNFLIKIDLVIWVLLKHMCDFKLLLYIVGILEIVSLLSQIVFLFYSSHTGIQSQSRHRAGTYLTSTWNVLSLISPAALTYSSVLRVSWFPQGNLSSHWWGCYFYNFQVSLGLESSNPLEDTISCLFLPPNYWWLS